ncbi:MAG TPA: hypothetical protein VF739_07705, partial [Ktedonobacterales bacterium]
MSQTSKPPTASRAHDPRAADERDERETITQLPLVATAPAEPEIASYTIHLPGFDGPLDLLLHLIEKNQME